MDSDVAIRFFPFEIISLDEFLSELKRDKINFRESMLVEWSVLPDILYEGKTNKFLGISFLILENVKYMAMEISKLISDSRCKYIRSSEKLERYVGFGDCDRLEFYFEKTFDDVWCELASLDAGAWVFDRKPNIIEGIEIPIGYDIVEIRSLIEAHGFVW